VALPSAAANRAAEYRARRNDLGEAFGTRKAKTQIKADERNKVDIGAMEGVRGHLMESIVKRDDEPGERV
jgi:DNA-directed RNA polymerase I subunit RPA49